jgi:hypothetical protein
VRERDEGGMERKREREKLAEINSTFLMNHIERKSQPTFFTFGAKKMKQKNISVGQ